MRVTVLVSLALAVAASSIPLSYRGTSSLPGNITDTAAPVGGKVDSATNPVTHTTAQGTDGEWGITIPSQLLNALPGRANNAGSITQTGDGVLSKAKGAVNSAAGSGAAGSLAGTTVGQASGNGGTTQAGGSIISGAEGAVQGAGAGAVTPPTTSLPGASA